MLFLKSFPINSLSFIYDEISGLLIFFSVETISALATRPTMSEFFKARTMQSQAVGIFAFATLGLILGLFLLHKSCLLVQLKFCL